MNLNIEALDRRRHNRSQFCCGHASLDNYLQKQASQDLKKRVATTFVLIDDPALDVLAYYTLSAYTVEIAELETTFAKRLPRYPRLPATLLGRLAVDQHQQGQGLGEVMLVDALQKALEVSTQVASLAVVAEAIDNKAVGFYKKFGFQPFAQHPMKLYLPMKSIAML